MRHVLISLLTVLASAFAQAADPNGIFIQIQGLEPLHNMELVPAPDAQEVHCFKNGELKHRISLGKLRDGYLLHTVFGVGVFYLSAQRDFTFARGGNLDIELTREADPLHSRWIKAAVEAFNQNGQWGYREARLGLEFNRVQVHIKKNSTSGRLLSLTAWQQTAEVPGTPFDLMLISVPSNRRDQTINPFKH